MTAQIGLPQSLRAEFATWRRSAVARLPLAGLAFGLVNTVVMVGIGGGAGWERAFGQQNLWAVFAGPMLTALLVAGSSRIDRAARGGGTWYRPVRPVFRRLSRFTDLAMRVLLLNFLAVVPMLLVIGLLSDVTRIPWGRAVELLVVLWASQLGVVAMLLWLAMHVGWLVVLGGGLVWTVLGVLFAESPSWPLLPFTWMLRGALPITGTHANGIALPPGDPLAAASPWAPMLLGAVLAVPFLLLPRLNRPVPRASRRSEPERAAQAAAEAERPGHPRVLRAMLATLNRTALWWLCPAAVGMVALWLPWHDPARSVELFTLVVLPIGTSVLGMVIWQATGQGWRAVAARPTGTTGPALALTGITLTITALVSLATALVYLAAGLPLAHTWPIALTGAVVGAMLTAAGLWLAVRTSLVISVTVAVIGVLLGILIGGTGLQQHLWPFVPWAWANLLDLPRMSITLPVSAVATVAFGFAASRAARRKAADS
ncbi:hypothetical protein SAMN02982929_00845 [Saccharopolyspora kobensis]|uniref:ABC-2 type transport system permease protein n=1 Tax=Saccharopolyspora kobensis TaxID=146035 RepID=A0A1H5VCY5_9PSEU|nr:hypothetical protein [Saccharopolyspora kobensis]SEF85212.1 hypothetical protein SAMN02982929_00845 [Saccharopolyspora kobensis]SFC62182.1 hypothetical protein SAMN05216506_1011225 [Saccharopolyspora kobensis]